MRRYGLVCVVGVVLTGLLIVVAVLAQGSHWGLVIAMVVANIFMMVPWHVWPMPRWFEALLAIARGFHWIVNILSALLGVVLLTHTGHPKPAMVLASLAIMFTLWASAARRLTYREPLADSVLEAPLA